MEIVIVVLLVLVLLFWIGRAKAQANTATLEADLAKVRQDLSSALALAGAESESAAGARLELERYRARESEIGSQVERATNAAAQLAQLEQALALADSLLEEREPVIYPRRFPDATTEELKQRMAWVKQRQGEIRRKGQVVVGFGSSVQRQLPAEERAKVKNLVRLARLALEGASDTLLDLVKATNQDRLDTRFKAVVEDLNRLLQPWGMEVGRNYQATVREQLELAAEYAQQLEKEREEQRALREQMREEAAAQREAEKAQREAEEEERRTERELARAQAAAARATLDERERWLVKVQELELRLAEAHQAKDRAVSMAQLTKAGHVYIVSNIGAFGDTVFKIGMTRRLDPQDRIEELGQSGRGRAVSPVRVDSPRAARSTV